MKKHLVLLALAAATVGNSFAQTAPAGAAQSQSPDQQADRRAQYLAKELGLSPDQQTKLQPILLAQRQEMLALRDKGQPGGRRASMGQALKASQARYLAQIKAILTPEQAVKFDQLKDEQREKMREHRQNGGAR